LDFFSIPKVAKKFAKNNTPVLPPGTQKCIREGPESSGGQPLILRGHRLEGGTSKVKGHPRREQAFLLDLKYTRMYKGKACSGGPGS
jgi:hypothetical protein